jgi:hypothetical protein
MEYTLLRYADTSSNLTDVTATADPGLAVELTRRWCRTHPDEGVIVTIGPTAVVHCQPRRPTTPSQPQRRRARTAEATRTGRTGGR